MSSPAPPPPPPPPPSGVPVTEAELHAHADRQLTPERAAEVAAWLAHRPDEAARVRAWEAHKRELRTLYDPVLDEAVPPALRRRARRPAPWFGRPTLAAAAALLLALAAGAGGWALRGAHDAPLVAAAPPPNDFPARAAIAHTVYAPEVKRPVEVDVGYALEGGRLLPGERGPVAQFMYRDEAGHRLTLYVSNEKAGTPPTAANGLASADLRGSGDAHADTAFRFASEGAVNVFWWVDGPFRYAITAPADRAALTQVSAEVYRQLAATPP
ncbi:MAG: anti-sigma factor [Burkholderiales bacterium]|nr:anti-sigma factor [Burkholderiales bacterium]